MSFKEGSLVDNRSKVPDDSLMMFAREVNRLAITDSQSKDLPRRVARVIIAAHQQGTGDPANPTMQGVSLIY